MVPELSKKQRKALVILSVTGGVYISFKYFLPLILPFAAAYLAALVPVSYTHLLADEITAMLDLASQKEIWLFLLEELERRNIGLIAVSHSEKLLEEVCHRVIGW